MATFLEPPALLSVAVVLAAGAGALYYGLRPALRGALPVTTSERDEVWGVDDPPPPVKRRYVYPADRPIEESPKPASSAPAVYKAPPEAEPEPFAQMPSGPAVAPVYVLSPAPPSPAPPPPPVQPRPAPPEPVASVMPPEPPRREAYDEDDAEEEVSLADLFRPRRRPPPPPKPPSAPDDAPTQD